MHLSVLIAVSRPVEVIPSPKRNCYYEICILEAVVSMLSGSAVTTAWRVFGLRIDDNLSMDNTVSTYGVAANKLNKQSPKANSGSSSSLGVGRGLTTPHRNILYLLRSTSMYKGLGNGRTIYASENGYEIWYMEG
jgi:hypothetical protein